MNKYGLTEEKYENLLKDCSDKVQKISDVDWQEIVEKYNLNIHYDSLRKSQQFSPFAGAFIREYYLHKLSEVHDDDNYLKELRIQKQELQKEKQKLSDERVEFNRQIRNEARKESYIDMVKRVICEDTEPMKLEVSPTYFKSDNDLLIHLTDIHGGIEIHNWKNDFDEDVLKERIDEFASKIISIREKNNSQHAYIVIGEIISGLIHNNLRLQNNLDIMEQFKYVSELISAMLYELSEYFVSINVYVTMGNHSRISPKKEDSLQGENMDVLLPFYLRARLQNINNIIVNDNTIEPSIAMFNIRGNKIFSSHGDKDSPTSVVQNWTMMFGMKPDIVLLGHRHTNGMSTVFDTKVIESGCISGSDDFAVSIRKVNRPEQTVAVITSDGLECLYDIQLD